MKSNGRAAVFFDRDGVVNRSPGTGYVTREEDFFLNDRIADALALCRLRGYLVVLVTSQRCVSKGLISMAGLDAIHATMQDALGAEAGFDSIHVFTGLPGSEHLEKPLPGLVHEAAEKWQLDLERSWLIGDADRDIVMARRSGISNTVRVRTHHSIGVQAAYTVDDISELVSTLGAHLPEV